VALLRQGNTDCIRYAAAAIANCASTGAPISDALVEV
jgi:hypothetical protein